MLGDSSHYLDYLQGLLQASSADKEIQRSKSEHRKKIWLTVALCFEVSIILCKGNFIAEKRPVFYLKHPIFVIENFFI